jgi:ATP-dependent Clp protease protease subunit
MESWIRLTGGINEKTAQAFLQVFDNLYGLGMKHLHLMLCSGGGSVAHGLGVASFLKTASIKCTTYGFGGVQSIAVPIFCAGEHRVCTPDATFMIHSVYLPQISEQNLTVSRLHGTAQELQGDTNTIASIISKASGQPVETVHKDMQKVTNFNAEEAKEYGLVHEISQKIYPSDQEIACIYEDGMLQYWRNPSAAPVAPPLPPMPTSTSGQSDLVPFRHLGPS